MYSQGYPTNIDSHHPSSGDIPSSGSITEQQSGIHTHNGRGPTNIGSSNFLNRPVNNGKPSGPQIETTNGRPSILAGRKTQTNGLDTGKFVDGTNTGEQPNTFGPSHQGQPNTFGPSHQGGLPNGRTPSVKSGYNHPDTSSPGRAQQPNRNGQYDLPTGENGLPNGRSHPTGLQPIDHSRNGGSQSTRQPIDSFGQPHNGGSDNGSGLPSSDLNTGLRNIFKLPPGLCLVRCDTLRPGQVSLNQDQIRDAFVSSGLGIQRKLKYFKC